MEPLVRGDWSGAMPGRATGKAVVSWECFSLERPSEDKKRQNRENAKDILGHFSQKSRNNLDLCVRIGGQVRILAGSDHETESRPRLWLLTVLGFHYSLFRLKPCRFFGFFIEGFKETYQNFFMPFAFP